MAWYRVFGKNQEQIDPNAFEEYLGTIHQNITIRFDVDDQGWFSARIDWLDGEVELLIERYSLHDDDIRTELNSWIAWLETQGENSIRDFLIEHITATQQLFTFQLVYDEKGLCEELSKYIAGLTNGVYQRDECGFFDSKGSLLLMES
jgi:hypothetical protein